MSFRSEKTIFDHIVSAVTACGCELVEVKWSKEFGSDTLTAYVFKIGGITLDDCESVHNAISPLLDELDASDDSYTLNVSSLGLDRPIVTDDDWRRSLQTEIEITPIEPIGKSKTLVGILQSHDNESIVLNTKKNGEIVVNKKNIARAIPFVRF